MQFVRFTKSYTTKGLSYWSELDRRILTRFLYKSIRTFSPIYEILYYSLMPGNMDKIGLDKSYALKKFEVVIRCVPSNRQFGNYWRFNLDK